MSRLGIYFGAVALSVLVLVGCGGGDDETTEAAPVETAETPAALTKEELLAQGDAICAEVNAAVGTVGSTSSETGGQSSQVAELYTGMVERLEGLGAPSDDSAGYEEFIGAAEQLAQTQSDVSLAAERGEDAALVSAESEASSALAAFQSAAETYGFEECAEAPSAPTPSAPGEAIEEEATGGLEEEVAPEVEEEVAPEEAPPVEEESAGGGAGVGGGTEGGSEGSAGGGSGGVGPG